MAFKFAFLPGPSVPSCRLRQNIYLAIFPSGSNRHLKAKASKMKRFLMESCSPSLISLSSLSTTPFTHLLKL